MTLSRKGHQRFYIPPESISDNTLLITQPEYHHVVDVMRYRKGDSISLFDGIGNEYVGDITSVDRMNKTLRIDIKKVYKNESLSKPLILVQSLVKGAKMDFIIQKATEMGVTHIFPVSTKHSVVRLDSRKEALKIKKWRRIIQEAGKQCGRIELPLLDKIWRLDEVLELLDWVDIKVICTVQKGGGVSLRSISSKDPKSIAVIIGPEGGFTNSEVELANTRGWTTVQLGKTILRTETATIAVLSVLCYMLGYWD